MRVYCVTRMLIRQSLLLMRRAVSRSTIFTCTHSHARTSDQFVFILQMRPIKLMNEMPLADCFYCVRRSLANGSESEEQKDEENCAPPTHFMLLAFSFFIMLLLG